MKRTIAFLIGLMFLAFLAFNANVPALASHLQDPCDPINFTTSNVYGHKINEFNGVTIYSNGACRGTGSGDYQCVEFVDRYFARQDWMGNGGAYFGGAPSKGLAPIPNGSTLMPKPEDILGFEKSGTVGHVAMVATVTQIDTTTYEVRVIEQNYSSTGEAVLTMVNLSNGGYSILSRDGFTVQGWLRYFPPPTIAPGMYEGASWNSFFSYAFLETYERIGGKNILGSTDTRAGETPYVHDWCIKGSCVALQDFWGGTLGDSALILNKKFGRAYLVRTAFWDFYLANEGPIALGEPFGEEHAPMPNSSTLYPCPATMLSCQAFRKGTLFWNGGSVIPMSNPDPLPSSPPSNLQIK